MPVSKLSSRRRSVRLVVCAKSESGRCVSRLLLKSKLSRFT